jgi:thymidine phosphorylase
LGGPRDFVQRPGTYLAAAPVIRPCPPTQPGRVQAVDARMLGVAVLALGGGRRRAEDKIDHRVGLTDVAGIGEHLDHARPLAMVHAADEATATAAIAEIQRAYTLGEARQAPEPAVIETILPEA